MAKAFATKRLHNGIVMTRDEVARLILTSERRGSESGWIWPLL